MKAQRTPITVKVTARVWLLRADGSFDYDSSYTRLSRFVLSASAALYQRGAEVVAADPATSQPGVLLAFVVLVRESAVIISGEALGHSSAQLWLPLGREQKQLSAGYRLSSGDVFCVGRTSWCVSEVASGSKPAMDPTHKRFFEASAAKQSIESRITLSTPREARGRALTFCRSQSQDLDSQRLTASFHTPSVFSSAIIADFSDDREQVCKVCLSGEETSGNPLVAPCACRGSVRYMHVKCLDLWLASKQRCREEASVKRYTWVEILCNVCRKPLARDVAAGSQMFLNVGIPKPIGHYLVLQQSEREIQVWTWNDSKTLQVGRGLHNDIIRTEAEVSYEHARLTVKKGGVLLSDANSQFGTLVLLQQPALLSAKPLLVQSGNALMEFSVKRKRSLFSCFSQRTEPQPTQQELQTALLEVVPGNH